MNGVSFRLSETGLSNVLLAVMGSSVFFLEHDSDRYMNVKSLQVL